MIINEEEEIMMLCAGQRMTQEDRRELEHNIHELELKIESAKHKSVSNKRYSGVVDGWISRLRRLRRMRE